MSEDEVSEDEIVHVPVPRRFLSTVYRALADAMAGAKDSTVQMTPEPSMVRPMGRRNLIDLITEVAHGIGANQRPVSLTELHEAYLRAYHGVGKGTTRGSFDATVNFHCINMRSRFPNANDRRKDAYWLSRPVFKRVARARYMLLSDEEIARFRCCVEEDNPLVYADEYDITDLALCGRIGGDENNGRGEL